ncbi:MAG: prolyl oligopeptidase family serine peptidase [Acidobacteriota bacterium]|nr:prolyl oligopeptidase family serine peptidase [Acidobacteriota bacterium]
MRKLMTPGITGAADVSTEIARGPVATAAGGGSEGLAYPAARRAGQVDDYHGREVADPYRWLEDVDSAETREWVEAENRLTGAYLARLPERPEIRRRLTELWNFERIAPPFRQGNLYFLSSNDGLQNQNVLYTLTHLEGQPRVLLDPNGLSVDGTIALASWSVSTDGRYLAYGLASGGSDWQEWRVRDVATGVDLADHLRWIKFSTVAWSVDGRGFFYSRYDPPAAGRTLEDANFFQKLYYHLLGTPQESDVLIHECPGRKDLGFLPIVTEDGRYLVVQAWIGTQTENGVYFKDLSDPEAPVVPLLGDFDASYVFLGNEGPVFWFLTDLGAPRGRVIAVDLRAAPGERPREVIPESAETLSEVACVGDRFIATYLLDAHSQVRVHDLDGSCRHELSLPGLGTVSGMYGRRCDREAFYSFTTFTDPGSIYRYDLAAEQSTLWRHTRTRFDPDDYESRQVFFTSGDGTRLPMFIVHRRDLDRGRTHPTYLYGYGGFNLCMTPGFSVSALVWMERGGIYVVPNLRGGGEYGLLWHRAGSKLSKQNTFDDFFAAAEWLIANAYTTPAQLVASGDSNGGLLAGVALVQRPELWGAVRIGAGVLDMLRFDKFTIGWGWVADYGSPDDPAELEVLLGYSPYHNLVPGTAYPATLITTADHDDRVVPSHSFKFAAALQAAQGGSAPVLIRIETRAGHSGKPVGKLIGEAVDEMSFLLFHVSAATGGGAPVE